MWMNYSVSCLFTTSIWNIFTEKTWKKNVEILLTADTARHFFCDKPVNTASGGLISVVHTATVFFTQFGEGTRTIVNSQRQLEVRRELNKIC